MNYLDVVLMFAPRTVSTLLLQTLLASTGPFLRVLKLVSLEGLFYLL